MRLSVFTHFCWIAAALMGGFPSISRAQTVGTIAGFPTDGFHPAAEYYANDQPVSIAVGDFNKDGKLDVAIANYYGSNEGGRVSILLGNGDGTFGPPTTYYSGGLSIAVATADFNKDGNLDLVVVNQNSADVSIFLGNGDGSFQLAVGYKAGLAPTAIAVGDYNGDGKADLAVSDGSGMVSILLGKGDGTFGGLVSFHAGVNPTSIVAGDFNGDGKLDLAVTNNGVSGTAGTTVAVLMGNGDGTFQPATFFAAGTSPRFLTVGDFNLDGKLDLVTANDVVFPFGGGNVMLGNGDGTFQTALPFSAAGFPFALTVADFNGDGKPDVAVANNGQAGCGDTVSVLLGNGDGTFQPAVNFGAGVAPAAIASADLNGDRLDDLIVADQGSNTISVLMATGASAVGTTPSQTTLENRGCWDRISQPGGSTLR